MTTWKFSAVVGALVLGMAGLAFHAFRERDRTKEALAAAVSDRDALQVRLAKSEQAQAAANERLAQTRIQAEALREDLGRLFPARGAAPASPPGPPPSSTAGSMLQAPGSPTTVRGSILGAENRGSVGMFVPGRYRGPRTSFVRTPPSLKSLDTLYPALYRQLGLSSEQAVQFRMLAVELAERFSDLDRRARAEQKRPHDPSLQPLYAAVDAEYRRKLAALVGVEAIPTVERFAETLFLRDAVAYFAGEFFYTDTPVSQTHADRLVEIMAKHLRDPNGRLDHVFADGTAMKSDAHEFLSPVHQAAWGQFVDDLARTGFGSLHPRIGTASGMTTR